MAMRTAMCLVIVEVNPDLRNIEVVFCFFSPTTQGTQVLVITDFNLKNLSSSLSTGSRRELTKVSENDKNDFEIDVSFLRSSLNFLRSSLWTVSLNLQQKRHSEIKIIIAQNKSTVLCKTKVLNVKNRAPLVNKRL